MLAGVRQIACGLAMVMAGDKVKVALFEKMLFYPTQDLGGIASADFRRQHAQSEGAR